MAELRSELATISALVPTLSIIGLFNFIHIAKQLKDDILLAQLAKEQFRNLSSPCCHQSVGGVVALT